MEPNYLNSEQSFIKIEDDNSHILINSNPSETLNELQQTTSNQNDETIYKKQQNQLADSSIQPTCSTTNVTTNQLDSDNYIHELLSDEDLQIIGFPNLQSNLPILEDLVESVDDLNNNLNNLELTNEDHIEVSSDSAISSMSRSVSFYLKIFQ